MPIGDIEAVEKAIERYSEFGCPTPQSASEYAGVLVFGILPDEVENKEAQDLLIAAGNYAGYSNVVVIREDSTDLSAVKQHGEESAITIALRARRSARKAAENEAIETLGARSADDRDWSQVYPKGPDYY